MGFLRLAGPPHPRRGGFYGGGYPYPVYQEPVQIFVTEDSEEEKIRKAKALLKAKGIKKLSGLGACCSSCVRGGPCATGGLSVAPGTPTPASTSQTQAAKLLLIATSGLLKSSAGIAGAPPGACTYLNTPDSHGGRTFFNGSGQALNNTTGAPENPPIPGWPACPSASPEISTPVKIAVAAVGIGVLYFVLRPKRR